jgi:hypothetical protein
MVSMPDGDHSGSVDVSMTEVDIAGTDAPELVVTLTSFAATNDPTTFVVCDAAGAWCTKPALVDGGAVPEPEEPRVRAPRKTYSYRRHPRGVQATIRGAGGVAIADKVFPLAPR